MCVRVVVTILLSLTLTLLLVGGGELYAEEVLETAADGTILLRYETNEQGEKHGRHERFYPDGGPALKVVYAHDKRNGIERAWDVKGTLRSAHGYKAGILHGAHRTYDEQGHLRVDQVYRKGILHGSYKSYYAGRHLHIVASYRSGQLHGKYQERTPKGATMVLTNYAMGKLHGKYEVRDGKRRVTRQVWEHGHPMEVDGIVPFRRSADFIRGRLKTILAGKGPLPTGDLDADRALALRQLQAYRFLVGVPDQPLVLDAHANALAQAASDICAVIGDITHTPENPGWAAARYATAYEGASSCNLHQGQRACTSVRGYMDDSDPSNIDKVGHRCWCMNPTMGITGFGHQKGFTAMWAMDSSNAKAPELPFLSLPPAGLVPGPWFGEHWAWSVSLAKKHFDAPAKDLVKPLVEPIGPDFLPTGRPLTLNHESVKTDSVGVPYLIVFRPTSMSLEAGRRYRVTIEGLTHKGKPKPLRYFVEFFDEPYETPRVPRTR